MAILNFLVHINFTDQNGHRPKFQVEIPVTFKAAVFSRISNLIMSFLAERLTIKHISNQNSKILIMTVFGIILGPEYAKKPPNFLQKFLFFQKKFHLMFVSGQTFENYNAFIECSIQSHKFKVVFTTCGSFWTNLQTRCKLTNY